jgi:hypothetical protein
LIPRVSAQTQLDSVKRTYGHMGILFSKHEFHIISKQNSVSNNYASLPDNLNKRGNGTRQKGHSLLPLPLAVIELAVEFPAWRALVAAAWQGHGGAAAWTVTRRPGR